MSTPLRAARTAQSFSATAPKVSVRNLHMTGPQSQSATALAFQNRMADLRKGERPSAPAAPKKGASINTTRALQKPNDTSPIDFYYMPTPPAEAQRSEIGLMPLIPDMTTSNRAADPLLASTDEIVRPEIAVLSGTEEGRVVAMSEAEAGKDADHMGVVEVQDKWEGVKKVWNGLLDDVLGEKSSQANVAV